MATPAKPVTHPSTTTSMPPKDPNSAWSILLFVVVVLAIVGGLVLAGVNTDQLTAIAATVGAVVAAAAAAFQALQTRDGQ